MNKIQRVAQFKNGNILVKSLLFTYSEIARYNAYTRTLGITMAPKETKEKGKHSPGSITIYNHKRRNQSIITLPTH